MLKYEQNVKHKYEEPDHIQMLVTSKVYGTEQKFIRLSKRFNKIKIDEEGQQWFDNPYKNKLIAKKIADQYKLEL